MSLDIIVGPMFAGKSSRILSIASRYQAINVPILVIKHDSDTRYPFSETNIVTHDKRVIPCLSLSSLKETSFLSRVHEYQVIIIDEAQFFTGLYDFVSWAVDEHGKNVHIMGLDGDSNRKPFGEILDCIPMADRVEKLTGFCHSCENGTPGIFSHRRSSEAAGQQVLIGGHEIYENLCRKCYMRKN